ncbi:MAG: ribonuclease J [Phototrophicales bacterium]|nr:ribonuclease J [Phototrophicales bacterium]
MAKAKLRIIPIGGLGEIGKNMTVFEMGNDAFIIDTGIMFPANDMHGVDYIIPDFRYLQERKDLKIHAIVYTHGHEDHIGAVSHVVEAFPNTPIYATPLTAGLLEVRLKDRRALNKTKINTFVAGDKLKIGPFLLESFHMCHSIPDCVGFGIYTPVGLIVYSGDYKFDNTPVDGKPPDYARLARFAAEGVTLLMAESTNADKLGWTPSETVIDEAFDRVFKEAKGRIFVATFASLISRVQQVVNAAQRHGRKVAIAGHSMTENVKMARRLGILNLPDDMLLDVSKMNSTSDHEIVVMLTGAQGEPTAALTKVSTGQHRQLEAKSGDTIILSSHPIPGNEEFVYRTINRLFRLGANVIYDPIEKVHVSGHASQDEMKLLLNLVKPKYFLPTHGELRHLYEHANIAVGTGVHRDNAFVVENGTVIEMDKYGVKVGERVPGGYVFVDGSGVGDVGRAVIHDREVLAQDGFMIVSVNVDGRTGKVLGQPEIISRGFTYLREADTLLEQIRNTIQEVMTNPNNKNGRRREKLQDSLSRLLYNETKRRPMIFGIINEK